jgi:hypothetical protein
MVTAFFLNFRIYSVNSIDGTFLMYKNEKKSAEVLYMYYVI